MTSIQAPWPPVAPATPLPFDQRGCCWPWGPCTPQEKLQLRYDVIGERDAGPVNPDWGQFRSGQVVIADAGQLSILGMAWTGLTSPGNVDSLRCEILNMDEATWLMHFQGGVWIEILGIPVFATFTAAQLFSTAVCNLDFLLERTFSDVIPEPPDRLRVKIVRWFSPSLYPYYG